MELFVAVVKGPAAIDVTVRIRKPVIQVESFVVVDRDFVVMFVTIHLSKIVMCNMQQLCVCHFEIKISFEMITPVSGNVFCIFPTNRSRF